MMNKKSVDILDQIRKDLHSLANYLENKEPFDDREIEEGRTWLLEIEHTMTGAIEKIEDVDIAGSINQALNHLPDIDSNPAEWPRQIYIAAKVI